MTHHHRRLGLDTSLVVLRDFKFSPTTVRVRPGEKVCFRHLGNTDGEVHIVCVNRRAASPALLFGQEWTYEVPVDEQAREVAFHDALWDFMSGSMLVLHDDPSRNKQPDVRIKVSLRSRDRLFCDDPQDDELLLMDAFVEASARNHLSVIRKRLGLEPGSSPNGRTMGGGGMRRNIIVRDVNAVDSEGTTALRAAAKNGHVAICELLASQGADLDATGPNGESALHLASMWGRSAAVRVLLAHGANLHAQDDMLRTPLHLAAVNGHVKAVTALLRRMPDPYVSDQSGKTPLDVALDYGRSRLEIGEILLDYMATGWRPSLRVWLVRATEQPLSALGRLDAGVAEVILNTLSATPQQAYRELAAIRQRAGGPRHDTTNPFASRGDQFSPYGDVKYDPRSRNLSSLLRRANQGTKPARA